MKANRTICDRQFCKAKLKIENNLAAAPSNNENIDIDVDSDKKDLKAELYLNIPNIATENTPDEIAVGAIPINPNTVDRIALCLDNIMLAAIIKNEYSVKIDLSDKKVKKTLNTNPQTRKFIVVTADGLPYKVMVELIKKCT